MISIEYFRSLKKVVVKNTNHLNIFSGKNDIGKSNVLKALDTFFNKPRIQFSDDFNKERLSEVRSESIKGKQYIKISIEFTNPGNFKTLPKKFIITKSWDRDGNIIEGYKDNFEALIRQKKLLREKLPIAKRSLTKFLNKIRFTYIPAIRDEAFFSYLLNRLQETIFEVEERRRNQTFQSSISEFNKTISELTAVLNSEFEEVSGIASTLSFPNNVSEIFQRLIIDTKSGKHDVPLRLRGDGIRLRYIPTILNYISKHSKYNEIWGFDEPENSCEYALSKTIADQFSAEYCQNSQIFVATHSFNFISLENKNTSKYRVFRMPDSDSTIVLEVDNSNSNLLSSELGILGINEQLAKVYDELTYELKRINETKEALAHSRKPYLIFEGETDNKLFEFAYESLYGKEISTQYILCEHLTSSNGSSIGSGARFINEFLYNHIAKIPTNNIVVGVFDFDETGMNEISALKKGFTKIDRDDEDVLLYQHSQRKNVYAMSLVAPDFRKEFIHKTRAKYCFLSTELLFCDDVISVTNKQYPTQFDKTVYSFTGDKKVFQKKVEDGKDFIEFSGFKPTFERLMQITSNKG